MLSEGKRFKALREALRFPGGLARPRKVTQKDGVSWDIYLDLCFKSLEELWVL